MRESVRVRRPDQLPVRPDWRLFDLERGVRRPAKDLHAFPVEGDGVNIVARHRRTYSPLRRRGGEEEHIHFPILTPTFAMLHLVLAWGQSKIPKSVQLFSVGLGETIASTP